MRIGFDAAVLSKVLSHLQSVVDRRSPILVILNVKIVADEESNEVLLSTTDLEILSTAKVSAEVLESGSITVPVLTLYEIVRKQEAGTEMTLEYEASEASAFLKSLDSEFELPTVSASEFPEFDLGEKGVEFSINSEILDTMLRKVRHAISDEEARYYLNGVFLHTFEAENGDLYLRAAATDIHRLARAQCSLPKGAEEMPDMIIPKKTVGEIIKLFESYKGDVKVFASNHRIILEVGNITFASRLIDGNFPDYNKAIPTSYNKHADVPSMELRRSVEMVTSVSNDKIRVVNLSFSPARVVVSSSSNSNGKASGTREVKAMYNDENNVAIGFNARYVLDFLTLVDDPTIRIHIDNRENAVVMEEPGKADSLYLLMPVQL